jgi:toxin secretion/phage lysis holin
MIQTLINNTSNSPIVKIFIIALLFDVFLGSLRAIKEKNWNSTIGINGMLRKAGMVGSVVFLALADVVICFNLIAWVPDNIKQVFNLNSVGLCDLFGLMFLLYELTSVLKNAAIVGIIGKKLSNKLQKILQKLTSELDGKIDKK